jgi:hypothetical protein
MDDLVPHIDWWAVFLQCHFDDLDGTVDSGAKAPGRRQQYG